jgi:hypothetical protein
MPRYGRESITMPEFGVALRLTIAQIRWHYTDLDNLFCRILREHVKTIAQAWPQKSLGEMCNPPQTPRRS